MLGHSTLVFASIDIIFVNSKPGLKVAFKSRANMLLLVLFTTYEIYDIITFSNQITSYLICLTCSSTSEFIFEHRRILTYVTFTLITLTNPRCRLCNNSRIN